MSEKLSNHFHRIRRWSGRLRVQLIAFMGLLMLFYVAISAGAYSYWHAVQIREDTRSAAFGLASGLAAASRSHMENLTFIDLQKMLMELKTLPNLKHISVLNVPYNILTHSEIQDFPVSAEEKAILNKTVEDKAVNVVEHTDFYDISVPVYDEQNVVGALFLRHEIPMFWGLFADNLLTRALAFMPYFLVCTVVIVFLTDRVVRPIEQMTDAAANIADGKWDFEQPKSHYREIITLSRAFKFMVRELKENLTQIRKLAFEDAVTGLANRARFRLLLDHHISRASYDGTQLALFFIDLDHFKRVNDTLGHDVGDALLREVAVRIQQSVRKADLLGGPDQLVSHGVERKIEVARLGGDEFTLIITNMRHISDAGRVAERIIDTLSSPMLIVNQSIVVQASVGISVYPADGKDGLKLLRAADLAMYQAKAEGRNTYSYFTSELDFAAHDRLQLEVDLRSAIENGNISVAYQPKVHFETRKVVGAEALARWNHPERGTVSPAEFIPVAEECRLIEPLGNLILRKALMFVSRLYKSGRELSVSVNVSAQQFENEEFSENVLQMLDELEVPPRLLELEITESTALTDPRATREQLKPLQEKGIRIAIDDFGTGYSNLAQLKEVSFDVFKIDSSFVSKIVEDRDSRVIATTIAAMAKNLKYSMIAEGVETEKQAKILCELGCYIGQGYLFGRAMPEPEFLSWLVTFSKEPVKVELIEDIDVNA